MEKNVYVGIWKHQSPSQVVSGDESSRLALMVTLLKQSEGFLDVEIWVLKQKLAFLFYLKFALQNMIPKSSVEVLRMLWEHLTVGLFILQVLGFTRLQLLLTLLGLGNECVAVFGVPDAASLLPIEMQEEELKFLRVNVDANFVAQGAVQLLFCDNTFAVGVQTPKSINHIKFRRFTDQSLTQFFNLHFRLCYNSQ